VLLVPIKSTENNGRLYGGAMIEPVRRSRFLNPTFPQPSFPDFLFAFPTIRSLIGSFVVYFV